MTGLIIGAVIISFAAVFVRLAGVGPDASAFYRLVIGGLGLVILLWRQGEISRLRSNIWLWSLGIAACFAADLFCWHRSILFVGPGMATMLTNFQVIVLSAVSVLLLGEKVRPTFLASMALALIGLYLMVGAGWAQFTETYRTGVLFGLASATAYSFYLLSLQYTVTRTRHHNPIAVAASMALCAGMLAGVNMLIHGESFVIPDGKALASILALALGCHTVGWFLITRGMQHVSTSLVGLILLLQPTLSYIWDVLFFGKTVSVTEGIGAMLALVGIYLGSCRSNKQCNKA